MIVLAAARQAMTAEIPSAARRATSIVDIHVCPAGPGLFGSFFNFFSGGSKAEKKDLFFSELAISCYGGLLLAKVASLLALFVSVLSKSFFQTFFQSYRKPFESSFFSANLNFQTALLGALTPGTRSGHWG